MKSKKGLTWNVLVTMLLVLLAIIAISVLIIGGSNILQDDLNRTNNGNHDKLENCLEGSVNCADAILAEPSSNGGTGK